MSVADLLATAPIQVLSPDVVERIAAGEVIERPVSVVRELLDNALDAGARDIRIDVRGGGLRSIRVRDDGSGIPADQIELAFRHHATSKLRAASDLAQLTTLGFRGEALPSIAAVADISLISCTAASGMAVRLDVRCGEPVERTYVSRTRGTTVTVHDLFANVPARLKFVGNARSESSLISQLVRQYALAHPDVRFLLALDGHVSLQTGGHGLERTLGEVFGSAVGAAMLRLGPVQVEQAVLGGFVSGRHVTRAGRHHITLLVNGRCVRSRGLLAAFEVAYRPLLPRGRHPIALLSVTAPGSSVDINVHPSKQEVKLQHESVLAESLKEATRALLGRMVAVPDQQRSFALGGAQLALPRMVAERGPEWPAATGARLRTMRVAGQVHGSLILLEDNDGLYLVDQHRAHERAIYELLLRRHGEGRAGQLLIEPLHVELSPRQAARLEPRLPELAALGFACEWFGGRSFLVRSVPVIPEAADLPGVIDDLLEVAIEDESDWQHRLLTAVACRTATRRGRALTVAQAQDLINLLADTQSPAVCPHGSPVILHFSDGFLERQFDW